MAQDIAASQRVDVRLDADEITALDRLCAEDVRTRPNQLKVLVRQEAARRDLAKAEQTA